jgi:estrone sulfotransferase
MAWLSDLLGVLLRKYRYRRRRATLLASLGFGSEPHQFFLVSYPKSGNTWVRMLLANLLSEADEGVSLLSVGSFVPDSHIEAQVEYVRDSNSWFNQLQFQFVKSHDPFMRFYRDKKVIYIVRDGRDVLNSYFHYLNARSENPVSILDLIEGSSVQGSWSEHVTGWVSEGCERKLFIRYEDLIRDVVSEMRKLLTFVGWTTDDDNLREAVRRSSFRNLQRLEDTKGVINPIEVQVEGNTPFFRKGKVGDWRDFFSEGDIAAFWKHHEQGMRQFYKG